VYGARAVARHTAVGMLKERMNVEKRKKRIYTYIYADMYYNIYICIYREREREREIHAHTIIV